MPLFNSVSIYAQRVGKFLGSIYIESFVFVLNQPTITITALVSGNLTGHTILWEQISGQTVTFTTPTDQLSVTFTQTSLADDKEFIFWIDKGTSHAVFQYVYVSSKPIDTAYLSFGGPTVLQGVGSNTTNVMGDSNCQIVSYTLSPYSQEPTNYAGYATTPDIINYGLTLTSGGTPVALQYLLVGGGGSGGPNGGGGGGGGGVLAGNITALTGVPYSINVGFGGSPITYNNNWYPTSGGNSVAFGFIAAGGGGGASRDYAGAALNGGSGGGGAGASGSPRNNPGTGITGQGFSGGAGTTPDQGQNSAGGGGGGAGAQGNAASYIEFPLAGNGGVGIPSAITGNLIYYGGGGGGGITGNTQQVYYYNGTGPWGVNPLGGWIWNVPNFWNGAPSGNVTFATNINNPTGGTIQANIQAIVGDNIYNVKLNGNIIYDTTIPFKTLTNIGVYSFPPGVTTLEIVAENGSGAAGLQANVTDITTGNVLASTVYTTWTWIAEPGLGGIGGGGDHSMSGVDGLGGGGGGGDSIPGYAPGSGGNGVIIIRSNVAANATIGMVNSYTVGSDYVYEFLTQGAIVF
jgi:hypothetical protein